MNNFVARYHTLIQDKNSLHGYLLARIKEREKSPAHTLFADEDLKIRLCSQHIRHKKLLNMPLITS